MSTDLEPIRLSLRLPIEDPGKPIPSLVFPETGIVSVVAKSEAGEIEVGFIGFEGVTGLAVVLGAGHSPNASYVQVEGAGHAISVEALKHWVRTLPSLGEVLMKYAHAFIVQTGQTALANGRAGIDARLSRWLLMASDRMESNDLPITHEFLSIMLGVRRPGVTDALHRLEGDLLIRARRGLLTIRNREGLVAASKGSYGVSEEAYRELFGDTRIADAQVTAG